MRQLLMLRWLTAILGITLVAAAQAQVAVEKIKLPPGFKIAVYAQDIPSARAMTFGDKGTLFVGSSRGGKVYAVLPAADGLAGKTVVVATGLEAPNGVAFKDGALFIGARDRILRLDDIEAQLQKPPAPKVVYDGYQKDAHHGMRVIRFGPDKKLYVSVGAPCNVCETNDRYSVITRLASDAGPPEVFARGVRNSVGYDWHPQTGELWFTDNGRDMLGNDVPPDELNHAPRAGMHFGFPYCQGGDLSDPDFGARRNCSEFTPPAQKLGPHVAALGMRFYTGQQFPAEYRNRIFIAEHGSWNRTPPLGYRIMMVTLRDSKAEKYEVFAEGWLQDAGVWGRPVDVVVAPDGALLVSDDKAGVIYRISYSK